MLTIGRLARALEVSKKMELLANRRPLDRAVNEDDMRVLGIMSTLYRDAVGCGATLNQLREIGLEKYKHREILDNLYNKNYYGEKDNAIIVRMLRMCELTTSNKLCWCSVDQRIDEIVDEEVMRPLQNICENIRTCKEIRKDLEHLAKRMLSDNFVELILFDGKDDCGGAVVNPTKCVLCKSFGVCNCNWIENLRVAVLTKQSKVEEEKQGRRIRKCSVKRRKDSL